MAQESGKPQQTLTFRTPPEYWLAHRGLDSYSEPLTTLLSSLLSLEDAAGRGSSDDEQINGHRWSIARAIGATSLELPDEARENLIDDVTRVYAAFSADMTKTAKNARPDIRAVRHDVDPDRETEGDPGSPNLFAVPVVVSGTFELTLTEALLEEKLRSPLIAAVTPYVAKSMDPTTAAAEIGLNVAVAKPPERVKAQAVYIASVASFEIFLNSVIGVLLDKNPQLLHESKESFTANQVLDAKNARVLKEQIRDKMLDDKTRSFKSRNDFLVRVLGEEASLGPTHEIVSIRNDLVHHAGRATQQNSCSYKNSSYQPGDDLGVNSTVARAAIRRLSRYATRLVSLARGHDARS